MDIRTCYGRAGESEDKSGLHVESVVAENLFQRMWSGYKRKMAEMGVEKEGLAQPKRM